MKVIYVLLALLLVGCQQPIDTSEDTEVPAVVEAPVSDGVVTSHVLIRKDSLWNETRIPFTVGSSRSATYPSLEDALAAAQAEADAYNYESIDDFWRVYIDEAPDIDTAPLVTVYVCNPQNNNVNSVWENISRRSLIDNYEGWKAAFYPQVIYIDRVPPPPIQDKDVNPYAWYALTVVDNDTGKILYEEHCGFNPDQSWSSDVITRDEVELYYSIRWNGYNSAVQSPVEDANGVMHPNCRLVTRSVYVEPSEI